MWSFTRTHTIKRRYRNLSPSTSRSEFVHTHGHSAHLHLTGEPGACSLKEWPLPLKPLSTLDVTLNSLRFRFTSEISERPGTCRCERYCKGERNWDLVLPQRETLCWARDTGDRKRRGDGELHWVTLKWIERAKEVEKVRSGIWRNAKIFQWWMYHGRERKYSVMWKELHHVFCKTRERKRKSAEEY